MANMPLRSPGSKDITSVSLSSDGTVLAAGGPGSGPRREARGCGAMTAARGLGARARHF
jgi:hypothetical protein